MPQPSTRQSLRHSDAMGGKPKLPLFIMLFMQKRCVQQSIDRVDVTVGGGDVRASDREEKRPAQGHVPEHFLRRQAMEPVHVKSNINLSFAMEQIWKHVCRVQLDLDVGVQRGESVNLLAEPLRGEPGVRPNDQAAVIATHGQRSSRVRDLPDRRGNLGVIGRRPQG